MKIIRVKSCSKCPYKLYNDGAGYCSAFITCKKFRFTLYDWGGPEKFDVKSGIHPECRLEDAS